ncbi:hypothetical protein [Actinoplanes sp. NPDC051494]|uniref:hypothetical protein n=1 Tax=Actinoplanes sp. NPDC051494 TaxID=3363907 RepID=UPI0037B32437
MTADIEHTPTLPSWLCRNCAGQWPCRTAKLQLLATLTPTQLTLHGWSYLEDAAQDLPALNLAAALARFVTWPEHADDLQPGPE